MIEAGRAERTSADAESGRVNGPPANMRTRLVQAAYEAALAEGRYWAPQAKRPPARARIYRDDRLTLLAPHFDYAFYADENPDARTAGLDELEHYYFIGWRKRRNPTAWFDTDYYLGANPQVQASGDNPFWHYIFKGRAEGRAPRRPRSAERAILENLVGIESRLAEAPLPDLPRFSAEALADRLVEKLSGASGFVFSFSCDDYLSASGNIELCIAEEEARFRASAVYLHACPLRGAGAVKQMPAAWSETRLTLNGEAFGVATDAEIAKALAALGDGLPASRAFVLHGVLGASIDGLMAIEAALTPTRRLFWLHDYSSLCTSPYLLRNDVAYCDAPPLDSQSCGVCVHGEARSKHLAELERLFQRCPFTVVASSEAALALWRRATALPIEAAEIVEHTRLEELAEPLGPSEPGEIGEEPRPVRVAYVGAPSLAEGWLTFDRILETCGELAAYSFHHFACPRDIRPRKGLTSVATTVRPDNRDLMRDRLIERRIDLVVLAAEWPQPFSFAAVEALAAGCDLVTLVRSGHAAALLESERRGRAFADADDVVDFFVSGKAIAYARERDRFPRYLQAIRREGGSAALIGATP